MSSCCPANSWPQLSVDYEAKGEEHLVGDLKLYVAGKNNEKCVIWNYDIYGFHGGRTRQLVDALADKGFLVILPDYYRGDWVEVTDPNLIPFAKKHTQWSNLKVDWEQKIKPFAISQGAKVFGAVGTCWGTYVVVHLCSYPEFKAGVSLHPSHPVIFDIMEEDEEQLLKAIKHTKQLFCPAGEDHENVRPGGLGQQVLGEQLKIVEFPEMKHGWTSRGNLEVENVARDVKKALDESCSFFKEHLKQ